MRHGYIPVAHQNGGAPRLFFLSISVFLVVDDASSLGPYWHGNVAASSSGPAAGEDDEEEHDDIE